jgi:hypothetical protein
VIDLSVSCQLTELQTKSRFSIILKLFVTGAKIPELNALVLRITHAAYVHVFAESNTRGQTLGESMTSVVIVLRQ